VPVRAWITFEEAKKLIAAAGKDFVEVKAAAVKKDFKPVSLGATIDFSLKNQIRHLKSRNVVGRLDGADPQTKDEYVIYSAHWDHLGRDPHLQGDQIYNGALDKPLRNCRNQRSAAFSSSPPPPKKADC
jgi:Zn-dependent M28 family amino/carboxypeptidase